MSRDILDEIEKLGMDQQALIDAGVMLERVQTLLRVSGAKELSDRVGVIWLDVTRAQSKNLDEIARLKKEARRRHLARRDKSAVPKPRRNRPAQEGGAQ